MRSTHMKSALSRTSVIALLSLVLGGLVQIVPANAVAPTITTWPAISASWSSDYVTLTAPTSNSAGAWTYTSSNTGIAVVAGSILILKGVGTSTITATQAATDSYEAGTVSTTLTVTAGTPTLGAFAAITVGVDSRTYTLTPPTTNSCGQTWTYASSNAAVATTKATATKSAKPVATKSSAGTNTTAPAAVPSAHGLPEVSLHVRVIVIASPGA